MVTDEQRTDGQMDGLTDGRTDGPTDRRTDGRTTGLWELDDHNSCAVRVHKLTNPNS